MGWTTTMVAGAMVLAIGGPASAGIIFDNFGAGDTMDGGNGWTLSDGLPIGIDFDQGDAFTVSGGAYSLDMIELAVSLIAGDNRLRVNVHLDDAGAPGSLLESVTVIGQMGLFGDPTPPIVAEFSGSTVLEDGAQYWIIASTDSNSWAAWHLNSTDDRGPHAVRQDGNPWEVSAQTRGAFRVTGQAIPAPGALAMFLVGPFALRRRRRATA